MIVSRFGLLFALLFGLSTSVPLPAQAGENQRFHFGLWGDMPYAKAKDELKMPALLASINAGKIAFSLYDGDIKDGSSHCTDQVFSDALAMFNSLNKPVVYIPGDNEWTDCHRPASGAMDPVARLARVREMFFADPTRSHGKAPLAVTPQSATPPFSKFVENARWEKAGVVFATVHIVGSNNNLQRDQAAVNEYIERNTANLAWIDATFARARESGAKAVVLAFQAHLRFEREPPDTDQRSGFNDTLAVLKRNAIAWGKPVLLIHGDFHHLVIDQPLIGPNRRRLMNVTRLMVHGEDEVHGTLVHVDTDNPDLFTFQPVYIPENLPTVKPAP